MGSQEQTSTSPLPPHATLRRREFSTPLWIRCQGHVRHPQEGLGLFRWKDAAKRSRALLREEGGLAGATRYLGTLGSSQQQSQVGEQPDEEEDGGRQLPVRHHHGASGGRASQHVARLGSVWEDPAKSERSH